MIRFVFRFVGVIILAGGFIALVRDGTTSIGGNAVITTALGNDWIYFDDKSLEAFKAALARHVVPFIGSWVSDLFGLVLAAPTFVVLGAIGAILILLGRKKKPLIGYGRD
jgi:hypothetical protein